MNYELEKDEIFFIFIFSFIFWVKKLNKLVTLLIKLNTFNSTPFKAIPIL